MTAADTEHQWESARRKTVLVARLTTALGALGIPALSAPALLLAKLTSRGSAQDGVIVGWMGLMCLPLVVLIWRLNERQMRRSNRAVRAAGEQLRQLLEATTADSAKQMVQARQKEFETELSNAMEMAEGEPEVIDVIERAFALAGQASSVELLLADNSHAHLLQVAAFSSVGQVGGCSVDSPDRCPAARRGQTQLFPDSEALSACPKLRGRSGGPCSAVCVPVSIMGRTVGVVHVTAERAHPLPEPDIITLRTIASVAGARLGMLRTVADAELQASTDSLTGLLNRRAFEAAVLARHKHDSLIAVAMGDLDHFKALNDTYGHETGDRALRLFAQVLRDSVRSADLLARHGGEEFVVAFPGCTAADARHILDGLGPKLSAAATEAGLPQFTVSFGVVDFHDDDLPSTLRKADRALFQAKDAGRNTVIIHTDLQASIAATKDASPAVHRLATAFPETTETPGPVASTG